MDTEHLFRAIVETAPVATMLVDSTGKISYVNHFAENLFDYNKEELIGSRIEMLIPERYRSIHLRNRSRYIKAPKALMYDADKNLFALRKNKTEVPVEVKLSPLPTSEGVLTIASVLDVSARKRAEERFRAMVESAPNAMILINKAGIIKLANKEAVNLFGYEAHEITGKQLKSLIPERFRGNHDKHSTTYFDSSSARTMGAGRDLYAVKKDGTEFPVEIGLNPIEVNGENVVVASIIDITQRKAQEAIINKQLSALHVKNKEMEQFNYIASHDLQEPLRTVSNYIQLLEEEYTHELNDDVKESLANMGAAVSRMTILVRSLLDYGRLGRHKKLVLADTEAIVKDVVSDLNNLVLNTSATISFQNLPVIYAYETELRQLFQNLINNAIKFCKKDIPPIIKVGCELTTEGYVFYIIDNGIGIKERYFQRVFNMFQRLNKEQDYEGYGIGLANCKKIADIHGGTIWVESEFGKGTTIKFIIPNLNDE